MVKREREKETVEDLKQAFRVFDKVKCYKSKSLLLHSYIYFIGWKRICVYFRAEICHE